MAAAGTPSCLVRPAIAIRDGTNREYHRKELLSPLPLFERYGRDRIRLRIGHKLECQTKMRRQLHDAAIIIDRLPI